MLTFTEGELKTEISTGKQFQINLTIDLLLVKRPQVFLVRMQTLLQITILNLQYRNIRFPIAKMTIIIATLIIESL